MNAEQGMFQNYKNYNESKTKRIEQIKSFYVTKNATLEKKLNIKLNKFDYF